MTILASVNNKTVMPGITPIADVPDTPTIGTATSAGLAASVTFTAATTGGTPTTFTATSTPGSLTGTASSSPITVSGLTEGTSYTFTVRASNSTGSSANSAASNSITAVSPITGAYDSLATVTLSAATSSVTFAGIPTGYKHLQIRSISQSGSGNSTDSLRVQFNGDTGANYAYHALYGTGATAASTANTGNNWAKSGQLALSTTFFSGGIIDVLDCQNVNKYKTVRSLSGVDFNGSGVIALESNLWLNTSAITSITISYGVNFAVNTSFALYGVK